MRRILTAAALAVGLAMLARSETIADDLANNRPVQCGETFISFLIANTNEGTGRRLYIRKADIRWFVAFPTHFTVWTALDHPFDVVASHRLADVIYVANCLH